MSLDSDDGSLEAPAVLRQVPLHVVEASSQVHRRLALVVLHATMTPAHDRHGMRHIRMAARREIVAWWAREGKGHNEVNNTLRECAKKQCSAERNRRSSERDGM